MKVGQVVYNNKTKKSGCFVSKGAKRTRVVVEHKIIKGAHNIELWKSHEVKESCQ